MTQPQYKLEELKIFQDTKETVETYSNIYDDSTLGIFLNNVSVMPVCIKEICEKSINNSLMKNYKTTGKVYTKDNFEISMTIDLNIDNGVLTICTYVGYWDLDLSDTISIVNLDCYEEIKEYFFSELNRVTTERLNEIKRKMA